MRPHNVESIDDLKAIHARHFHVGHDGLKVFTVGRRQALLAIFCAGHFIAFVLEDVLEQLSARRFVFD